MIVQRQALQSVYDALLASCEDGMTGEADCMRYIALLHDVLEDTDVTAGMLLERGYSERVVRIVQMLSRPVGITYMDWIARLKATGDDEVIAIKLADNADNFDPSRIACLPETERGIARRYEQARAILTA